MITGDDQTATGMRDVWCWALSWFRKPPSSPQKRARQTELVAALLEQLRQTDAVWSLHDRYCGDSRWQLKLARERFPRDWATLGLHACAAAAYGIRFVELSTGKALDPAALPAWVGEWAVW